MSSVFAAGNTLFLYGMHGVEKPREPKVLQAGARCSSPRRVVGSGPRGEGVAGHGVDRGLPEPGSVPLHAPDVYAAPRLPARRELQLSGALCIL